MASYSSTQPENVSIVNEAQKDMVWTSKTFNTYEDALMVLCKKTVNFKNLSKNGYDLLPTMVFQG